MLTAARSVAVVVVVVLPVDLEVARVVVVDFALLELSWLEQPATTRPVTTTASERSGQAGMHRRTVARTAPSTRSRTLPAMKYVVLVPDGCADEPVDVLDGKTPLEAAALPNLTALAARSEVGRANVIPGGLPPGSDVGNLSILGYDPSSSTPAGPPSKPRRWASTSRPTRSRTGATS